MHRIVGAAIDNWRLTLGILFFALVGGILALSRLPLDAEPDIPVPFFNIVTVLPGISPEDAERLLVRPLEEELKSIDGIKELNGIAQNNAGIIALEFEASFDQDLALQDVLEKVDRARAEFPSEAEEPVVEEFNSAELPIFIINLYGDVPERTLQRTAKDLQQRIEGIPSVLSADIAGEREDVLEAVVDPVLVDALSVSYGEIVRSVQANNALITAGALESSSGQFNVKLPGLIEDGDDLADLVIRQDASGAVVRMRDIADIRRGYRDVQTYARFNGQPSVSLEIAKRNGENIVETIADVKAVLEEAQAAPSWPPTLQVRFTQDKSEYIFDLVNSLSSSIINAVILVFIVCIAALGFRSAIFVGFAIPSSFLIALFFLWVQGETLNMMIMFGLILSVGVLVDSAIVIVEYADRKMAEGLDRKAAYRMAGERMFWPIISSTATTLAAFLPLLFWNSVTGKFMSYFPLTMIYVLSASVLMALLFLPTLGSLLGPKKAKGLTNAAALSGAEGDPSQLSGFTGWYAKLIGNLIPRPFTVLAGVVVICTLIVMFFRASVAGPPPKPVEFFTQTPSDQVFILVRSRGNSTPADKSRLSAIVEGRLEAARIEGIEAYNSVAGAGAGGSGGGGDALTGPSNVPNDTVARIYLDLEDFKERRSVTVIQNDVRELVADIPGIYTEVTAVDMGPPIDKDIGVELRGRDREAVKRNAQKLFAYMEELEGVFEVESTLPLPGIEWEIVVDRTEAGRLGLDTQQVGAVISFATEGALVDQYRPLDADDEVDIRVRLPETYRNIDELDRLRVQTPQGGIPLSSVVTRNAKPADSKISRRDQAFVFEVKANTMPGFATNLQTEAIREWLSQPGNLEPGVDFQFLGQEAENAEAAAFGQAAAAAIIFMMGVILLMQFNSYYHVVLTLSAVVLSIFGVLLGLAFYPFISMVLTMTGVIALAGIVVNNNIVLIDTYQRLTKEGFAPDDAALRTAAQRLRPVVLTTITTVVGLMPLVIGFDANILSGEFDPRGSQTSDIWKPISYAIVTGLSFSTLVTLFLTPVMLAAPHIVRQNTERLKIRRQPSPEAVPVLPSVSPAGDAKTAVT